MLLNVPTTSSKGAPPWLIVALGEQLRVISQRNGTSQSNQLYIVDRIRWLKLSSYSFRLSSPDATQETRLLAPQPMSSTTPPMDGRITAFRARFWVYLRGSFVSPYSFGVWVTAFLSSQLLWSHLWSAPASPSCSTTGSNCRLSTREIQIQIGLLSIAFLTHLKRPHSLSHITITTNASSLASLTMPTSQVPPVQLDMKLNSVMSLTTSNLIALNIPL